MGFPSPKWRPVLVFVLGLVSLTANAQGRPAVEEVNDFALRLYDKLSTRDAANNVMFSPLSVAAAFSVVHLGANGTTRKQLEDTFGFGNKDVADELLRGNGSALVLATPDDGIDFLAASDLFLQDGFDVALSFKIRLTKTHSKAPKFVNFTTDPEGSRRIINEFVNASTRGNINELIPKGAVDEVTRMVLANAVFFEAGWSTPFDSNKTFPMQFRAFGVNRKVDMMTQETRLKLVPFVDSRVLELPYGNGAASMVIVLPNTDGKEAFLKLEEDLRGIDLTALLNETRTTKVKVFLPRFQVEGTADLTEVLPKLGVKDLFSQTGADLSELSRGEGLYISSAFHTAKVMVDEKGTTASAATGAAASSKIFVEPEEFKANRPFVYFIIDNASKVILFMGNLRGLPQEIPS
ncbi:unnamed protein product [Ostreobium quekettii]|uniref:Serpin domain-containing protein n=1 Tax=Ostreobium quekettii TaxID=121088 RepID=A0A8S1IYN5_9CHLO|nr:unnamed protein product [Ostreobium quekettii]|eukprot:evm.model.scf_285EXC.9 EVM.evm.TU.scf_285EXC.9   scf_285EXC:61525-64005(-)